MLLIICQITKKNIWIERKKTPTRQQIVGESFQTGHVRYVKSDM